MTNLLKITDGKVLHFDQTTRVATAVNHENNKLFTFDGTQFHSGWPVRLPAAGDKIRIRQSLSGEFLCARLADD